MYETAIQVLKKLNDNGFKAYIVGGYPRNHYLGISSTDIDICTNATPIEISSLFYNVNMSNASYGAVSLTYGNFCYEITTFRKDKAMLNGDRFYSVEYVNTLDEDLCRRDFVMNTLCIDKDGNYVDCLGAIKDIDNKMIQTVKEASLSFREDPLRILRAIRFSTTLSFSIANEVYSSIISSKELISRLSLNRIKDELDLIFSNHNCMVGISYLRQFEMENVLSLGLDNISYSSNYLGIWAQCSFKKKYPFSRRERKMVDAIQKILPLTPSFLILYQYGMDVCSVVDEIHQNHVYFELNQLIPIHNREDINVDKKFLLSTVPKHLISTMYKNIENEILSGNLPNKKENIQQYILENI